MKFERLHDLVDAGVASVLTGPFGSALHASDYCDQGVCVVPAEAIRDGRLDQTTFQRISEDKAKELARYRLFSDDIVFARRGAQACGRAARVTEGDAGAVAGTGLMVLRVHKPDIVDPVFLSIVVGSKWASEWLRSHAIGATMPNLNREVIGSLPIKIPVFREQLRIAGIVRALDDKIELNGQTNQTLEALAQRLFQSWFVDFDPVKAKLAGRAPAHLDTETAALFPDRLVESELGLIPEGWSPKHLGNLVEINPQSHTAKTLPEEISYIDISSASDGDVEIPNTISKHMAPSRARRIAVPGDTVWSMVRPNRRAHFFFDADFPDTTVISTGFAVLHPPSAACFWYYLTNQSEFSSYLEARATGAAYPAVNARIIEEFCFPWPGSAVAEAFDQAVQRFKERQGQLRQECGTLSQLRDLLLPKLISGQLRVRDTERQIAEVV